jgi:hypothetical protein
MAAAVKNVRRLEDILANVATDEHDEDRGRPAKRHETEALRAALMATAQQQQQQPLGIREGQAVVDFPEARGVTGENAVARADGRVWDRMLDRKAMQEQPYTQAMRELASVQRIIARDPNKRFIDMYATKTNQRVQALYDQDKLRILGAREAEIAAARRLDQQRKIVNAPAKEKQLEGLRAELARIEARLALVKPGDPVLRVVGSRAVDYLDAGMDEDPASLGYLLQSTETALFVERMARQYQARLTAPLTKTDYSLVDMSTAVQLVRTLWEQTLEAGTAAESRSDAAERRPEDVVQERKKLDAARPEDETVELMLAGYALSLCLSPNGTLEGREPYLYTAYRALSKALNWFYMGLTEFTGAANLDDVRAIGEIYTQFKRLMTPFADWQNRLDRRDAPFDLDAARAMVQLLADATARMLRPVDDVEARDINVKPEPGIEPLPAGLQITEITLISAEFRNPVAFLRSLKASLERLAAVFLDAVDAYIGQADGPTRQQQEQAREFDMELLQLILGEEQVATGKTFETWYAGKGTAQNGVKPALSSILTTSNGTYITTLAASLVNFFERLAPAVSTNLARSRAAARGYAHPWILFDVQSLLKLALSGLLTKVYEFVGPLGQKLVAIDETFLEPYVLTSRAETLLVPYAPLEWTLLTAFDTNDIRPLRLMLATYALNRGVAPQLLALKQRLASLEKQKTASGSAYEIVDVYESFPALILLHLARAQLKIVQQKAAEDKALAESIEQDIHEGERILGEITAERHGRHGLLNPGDADGSLNERDAYQQPLAWAQLPEISGFLLLSPNVTGQLDAARVSLGDHVPALRDIPLDVLTTQHDSGLAAWFCEYCAVMHARDELAHQTQFGRHEQYPENKRRLFEVIQHLKKYTYSRAGRSGPVTVYRNGTPYRQQALFEAAGGVDTVGLF